jgi:hypothetical protein
MTAAQQLRFIYDPDFDHFMIDGTYSFTRPILVVDGYEAHRKFTMYFEAFMHEVEAIKRAKRQSAEADSAQPDKESQIRDCVL